MISHKNASLKRYNTFGIACNALEIIELNQLDEAKEIISYVNNQPKPLLILGGGSNVLFTQDFDGIILLNNLKGITIISETEEEIVLRVAAGEVWHQLVMYCVENGYAGMENLSLIPGKVGASPMQNIGAYGVEVKDLITQVNTIKLADTSTVSFSNADCKFDYRSSIFKTTHKNQYLITSVDFLLNKSPSINTSYGAINSELEARNINHPTIKDVSAAVISIRSSKLPDPAKIGNAGSFFKNPVINLSLAEKLKNEFPEMPQYEVSEDAKKIAAGWLIEQCGWKGKTINNHGVHKLQALVLVNYSDATGKQIFNLSSEIIDSVKAKFGVELEREVNII
mgnify:CR=1 FL=1|tara:strand:- start:193 stop:1209 length:1017 start_codon:yes stop_codon:yes gene_type:complete